MTIVRAKPDESPDSVIRRFKKKVLNSDILLELKKREFYQKPALQRKERKAELKRRRRREKRLGF